jgi:hypothetical protein
MMSTPRYRRGNRLWLPTASITDRPAVTSSSASCVPLAEAPTMSTPPSGRVVGLR